MTSSVLSTPSGVGFSVWGNTPGSADSQEFQVSIDDSGPYTSSTSDPTPQTWMQWYQSPTLNSGRHGVNISSLYGEAVDLIAITPGPDTPLSGRTLIVDDGHPSIKYEGKGWKEEGGRYRQGGGVGFVPFQNSTHNTETVGDSFTFTFSGESSPLDILTVNHNRRFPRHESQSLRSHGRPCTRWCSAELVHRPRRENKKALELGRQGPRLCPFALHRHRCIERKRAYDKRGPRIDHSHSSVHAGLHALYAILRDTRRNTW